MSRWIDADALTSKPWFVEIKGECIDDIAEQIIGQCKQIVKDAPSIDIVFCKECKWADKCSQNVAILETYDMYEKLDFCSHGEREGE